MKIRLMGMPDLVRRWQAELERAYNVKGTEYANRGGDPQIRVYFDLDDREAEAVLNRAQEQAAQPKAKRKQPDPRPAPPKTAQERPQRPERDITPRPASLDDLRKRLKRLKLREGS